MAGVRLKWLRIEKYRNVAPGTELHFSDKFNVLLGKNGTGKTTLLKLIAMIVTDGFTPLADKHFEFAYVLEFVGLQAKVHIKREQFVFVPGASGSTWSYDVSFKFGSDPGVHEVHATSDGEGSGYVFNGIPHPGRHMPSLFGDRFLQFLLIRYKFDVPTTESKQATLTAAWDVMRRGRGGRFDEELGGFTALTEGDSDSIRAEWPGAKITLVTEGPGEAIVSGGCTFTPQEVFDKVWTSAAQLPETVPLVSSELNFLSKSVAAMNFKDAQMLVRRQGIGNDNGQQVAFYTKFAFNFTLSAGELLEHKDLSFGQKRLLSFLYYAACNPDIIVADELVNGLHHDWAQLCVDEIAERQSFLAGQDPLLFDFLFFESEEEVRQSFILCSLEQLDGRGHFVWKNLSPENAASFYRAYKAGIQHVSEILYSKGLW